MADTDTIFDPIGFDQEKITCSNCGWTGPGSEAIIIDFYGIGKARQVKCPNCKNNLGSLPRINEPKSGPFGSGPSTVD
jgi:hypothetical protein